MTDIPILLVIAAVIGAGLNVARGATQEPRESFSFRKTFGGLIAGIVGALAAVTALDATAYSGQVSTIIIGLLTGFGSDYTFSKLKKS